MPVWSSLLFIKISLTNEHIYNCITFLLSLKYIHEVYKKKY